MKHYSSLAWSRPRCPSWSRLLLAFLLLCASASHAADRSIEVRWYPPSEPVDGYVVYYGYSTGTYASEADIGSVSSGADGIARYTLAGVDAERNVHVAMTAYGADGVESELSNEIVYAAEPSSPVSAEPIYAETFEGYASGADPADWLDTASGYSLQAGDPALFRTHSVSGGIVFGTTSTEQRIHSHLVTTGTESWNSYEFSGRMMQTDSTGGIGVTMYSAYPQADAYYRLWRYGTISFRIAPRGATCTGTTDTGVVAASGVWYRFRMQAEPDGTGGTVVRAKVWSSGQMEPLSWQAECVDSAGTLLAGRPGMWATNAGAKYWDDLVVSPLASDGATEIAQCATDVDCSDGNVCNGVETCEAGVCTSGAPLSCSSGDACTLGYCDPQRGCVLDSAARDGQTCDDGNGTTYGDVCSSGACIGQGCLLDAHCDEGLYCNGAERCANSSCLSGEQVVCDDGDVCNGLEVCDESSRSCSRGPEPICDANPGSCAESFCDPVLGCRTETYPDGTSCRVEATGESGICQVGTCTVVTEPEPEAPQVLYLQDFELMSAGSNPAGWYDTLGNRLTSDDGLYRVLQQGAGMSFGATTTSTSLSHLVVPDGESWRSYEFSGRLMRSDAGGAIGVTIYSGYPTRSEYYRVRAYDNKAFHFSPRGTSDRCEGRTGTGVVPEAGSWYRFRFQAYPELSGGTALRMKVWRDGEAEPSSWQMDCVDRAATFTAGRPGIYAQNAGAKYWDDLVIREIPSSTP